MRSFIVASVLAVMLTLFVAAAIDASRDGPARAAQTDMVLMVEAECPHGTVSGAEHAILASHYGNEIEASEAACEDVLKLPADATEATDERECKATFLGTKAKLVLKLPHYNDGHDAGVRA